MRVNEVRTNPAFTFMLSRDSVGRLVADAKRMGISTGRVFSTRALFMARDDAPKFSLSGEQLTVERSYGLHPRVFKGLEQAARRMGVPISVIGEFVAAYDLPEATA